MFYRILIFQYVSPPGLLRLEGDRYIELTYVHVTSNYPSDGSIFDDLPSCSVGTTTDQSPSLIVESPTIASPSLMVQPQLLVIAPPSLMVQSTYDRPTASDSTKHL